MRVVDSYCLGIVNATAALTIITSAATHARTRRFSHRNATLVTQGGSRSGEADDCPVAWLNSEGAKEDDIKVGCVSVQRQHAGERDGGGYLGCGEQVSPEDRASDNLLRDDDNVPGTEPGGENLVAIPSTPFS